MTSPERIAKGLYWDRAWGLVCGCTPVSPSCDNCWAAREANIRAAQKNPKIRDRYAGLIDEDGKWTGRIRLNEKSLDLPLRVRKPTVWAVWNDLFHEDVPDRFIADVWGIMRYSRNHIFFILTKRPERMQEWFRQICQWEGYIGFRGKPKSYGGNGIIVGEADRWPLPNVWLGVTSENQEQADKRIPILLQIPAAVRFVSCEPLLGPVDLKLGPYPPCSHRGCFNYISHPCEGCGRKQGKLPLDWIICGSETGPNTRPVQLDWVRSLRDQCVSAGVPFFLKQLPSVDGKRTIKMPKLDGKVWSETP